MHASVDDTMRDLYWIRIPAPDAGNARYAEDCECRVAKMSLQRLATVMPKKHWVKGVVPCRT